jgi:CheY-like chemotaxis protein/nitrogen-specific signal transduction histidine kinase
MKLYFNKSLSILLLGLSITKTHAAEISEITTLKNGFFTDGSINPREYPDRREIESIITKSQEKWKPYRHEDFAAQFKEGIPGNVYVVWLRYVLPETTWRSPVLSLSAVHDVDSIYVGNRLVYYSNKLPHVPYFDEGLKDWWMLVPLPSDMTDKSVYIKLVSEHTPGVFGSIKIGEYEKIIKGELHSDIIYFSFSVSLIMAGFFFLFMIITHRRFLTSDFWLCFLFMASGTITLTWSKVFFILLDFSDTIRLIRIGCLGFLPFLFILFFQSISWSKTKLLKRWMFFLFPLAVTSVILIEVELLSVQKFSFILIFLFASSLGVILYTGLQEIWKNNKNRKPGSRKFIPEGVNLTLFMELGIAFFAGTHDLLIIQNIMPYSADFMPLGIFLMMVLTAFYLENNFRKNTNHHVATIKTLKEKSLSLAGMSHEIRIPLTGIIGMGNLLNETFLNEEQKGYLGTIRSSSISLLNQINDILDFAKIDSTQMHLEKEPFNLYETIENIIKMVLPRAAEQRDDIYFLYDAELPEVIIGDTARTGQILTNLLGNSVKFTWAGDIELRVSLREEQDAKWIELCVHDTGIGIDNEKLEKIFDPFSQADNSISRKFGGTGLGLYISKKLAELMDGSLTAKSAPGSGSSFTLRLPLKLPDEGKNEQSSNFKHRQQKNILILGEHPGLTLMVNQTCSRIGYKSSILPLTSINHTLPVTIPGSKTPWDLVILVFDEFCFEKFYLKKIYKDSNVPIILIMPLNLKKDFMDILHEIGIPYVAGLMTKKNLKEKIDGLLFKKPAQILKMNKNIFAREFPQNILVVDDNPVNRIVVEKMLQHLGYIPDFATNGLEAVNMAIANLYDLIFMDIQMPEKDGITVSREILGFWDSKNSPRIIAMTSDALREDRNKFTNAGMVDCILKPPSMEQLQKIIVKHGNFSHIKQQVGA